MNSGTGFPYASAYALPKIGNVICSGNLICVCKCTAQKWQSDMRQKSDTCQHMRPPKMAMWYATAIWYVSAYAFPKNGNVICVSNLIYIYIIRCVAKNGNVICTGNLVSIGKCVAQKWQCDMCRQSDMRRQMRCLNMAIWYASEMWYASVNVPPKNSNVICVGNLICLGISIAQKWHCYMHQQSDMHRQMHRQTMAMWYASAIWYALALPKNDNLICVVFAVNKLGGWNYKFKETNVAVFEFLAFKPSSLQAFKPSSLQAGRRQGVWGADWGEG
jgi:hypothetical protein